ncbi:unnamed protein product, partial [Closterium sp. NIES-53]
CLCLLLLSHGVSTCRLTRSLSRALRCTTQRREHGRSSLPVRRHADAGASGAATVRH